ncbi:hypothetical protein SPRG_15151, partial [Saprolegnia parasitica CBS 223.65]
MTGIDKQAISPPVVARGLQLLRETVLRIGNSELEVVAIKEKQDPTLSQGMQNKYWNERIALLQQLPWLLLHSIPNGLAEITHVAYHAKEVEFRAGESIYKQGHDALNAYIVLQGHIILHRNGSRDGTCKYLEQLGPGDWCGEVALLGPPARLVAAYDTHAIAQTNVVCVVLSARELYYMCGNYRELYQVPLARGIVEREVCPTLLHRVGFKLKLLSFPAGTDLSAQGLGLYCLVRGSVLCKCEAEETVVRAAWTWFGELTSLASPPLSVHAQDTVGCYTLSLEEYKRSIELSLIPPTRNDPRLQVGTRDRGLSRADLSHATAKKEASVHLCLSPKLGDARPFWMATFSEHMADALIDEGSGNVVTMVQADAWRQKKRNVHLLQARLQHLHETDSIEYALVLYVLSGPKRGDVHVVYNCAVLGNDPAVASIVLSERDIAPAHAWIYHRNGAYFVQDLGTSLGTYIRLKDNEATSVRVGDVLVAGETEFTLEKSMRYGRELDCLSLSLDTSKLEGAYAPATPEALEGGALRGGPPPVYWSAPVLALLAQYAAVGLVQGGLASIKYPILTGYFQLEGNVLNSGSALMSLGWSLKVFFGLLSDCFPIVGYHRKPYIVLGWLLTAIVLVLLAAKPSGAPAPDTKAAANGAGLTLLCALACFFFILADVAQDALLVQYAQREPDAVRGRLQSMVYAVRALFMALISLVSGVCLNSTRMAGSFDWDIGIQVFFAILAVPTVCNFFVACCYLQDEAKPRVPLRIYGRQLWTLTQKRAVWQIMIFNFVFGLLTSSVGSTAAPYVALYWAHVETLNAALLQVAGHVLFAAVLFVMGAYGTHWDWRAVLV